MNIDLRKSTQFFTSLISRGSTIFFIVLFFFLKLLETPNFSPLKFLPGSKEARPQFLHVWIRICYILEVNSENKESSTLSQQCNGQLKCVSKFTIVLNLPMIRYFCESFPKSSCEESIRGQHSHE